MHIDIFADVINLDGCGISLNIIHYITKKSLHFRDIYNSTISLISILTFLPQNNKERDRIGWVFFSCLFSVVYNFSPLSL
ncbi:hypothetical protein HanIR_Chr14g0710671 [Helianthus annuus]|nr:hypothetical protein HanIR_Chr14g0710671 [Helianthus annuus]